MGDELNELALFAGAGGGILGGFLEGWKTVCAVEIEPFCREVLLRRQMDGCLPKFPIWDDVCTFDGHPWRGHVDVITGGFPCQDISAAGKGAGITGSRSGLWSEMARIIGEVRPRYVLVENSPLLVSRGLDVVLSDLASLGYDAVWGVIGAHHAGAPHKRDRIWILAYSEEGARNGAPDTQNSKGISNRPDLQRGWNNARGLFGSDYMDFVLPRTAKRKSQSGLCLVVDGMASQVDELKAIGNGQVPAVAALAWDTLTDMMEVQDEA